MKILLLADQAEPTLWEHLDKRKLEGVELVLSCGDLPASYLSFLTCFTSAPILYIRGNHDDRYDKHPPEGCECIEDQVVTVGGLRILGLGGSMRYNRGINQYTEREMRQRVNRLRFKPERRTVSQILRAGERVSPAFFDPRKNKKRPRAQAFDALQVSADTQTGSARLTFIPVPAILKSTDSIRWR